MKRIITYIVCAAFLLASGGNAWAVEKKSKDKPKSKTEQKKKPETKKPAKKPTQAKKKPAAKKYDDFVDKNKNGIDDRRENLKKKPSDKKKKD